MQKYPINNYDDTILIVKKLHFSFSPYSCITLDKLCYLKLVYKYRRLINNIVIGPHKIAITKSTTHYC